MPVFDIVSRSDGDWAVLQVEGDIDVYTAPRLKQAIADEIQRGARHIVLELTKVGFLDSTGLAVMVGGVKQARSKEGSFGLVGPNDQIRRILTITDLIKILPIHDSLEEARGKAG